MFVSALGYADLDSGGAVVAAAATTAAGPADYALASLATRAIPAVETMVAKEAYPRSPLGHKQAYLHSVLPSFAIAGVARAAVADRRRAGRPT